MRPYYLKGKITNINQNKITIESFSVGYLVEVIDSSNLKIDEEITLFIYEFQYEEKYSLYGFLSEEDLHLFQMLLEVRGVGPRTALSLFRKINPTKLKTFIVEGSASSIGSICDLGPITSSNIVATLRPKIKKEGIAPRSSSILSVIKATKALGFKEKDIEPIIDEYSSSVIEEGELLKIVLKKLRREPA